MKCPNSKCEHNNVCSDNCFKCGFRWAETLYRRTSDDRIEELEMKELLYIAQRSDEKPV